MNLNLAKDRYVYYYNYYESNLFLYLFFCFPFFVLQVDLSGLKSFTVLHHLPLIHTFSEFNIQQDVPKLYSYKKDCYQDDVKYEIEGDRRILDMSFRKSQPHLKTAGRTTDRKENFFEPLAIGIGVAVEEENERRIRAAKKKQFDDMLAKKRQDEEKEKQRLIQEMTEKEGKEKAEKNKKEMEEIDRQMKEQLETMTKQITSGDEVENS